MTSTRILPRRSGIIHGFLNGVKVLFVVSTTKVATSVLIMKSKMTVEEHIKECLRECNCCSLCLQTESVQDGESIVKYCCWIPKSPLKATVFPLGFIKKNGIAGDKMRKLFLDEDKNRERRHCPYYVERTMRIINLEDVQCKSGTTQGFSNGVRTQSVASTVTVATSVHIMKFDRRCEA